MLLGSLFLFTGLAALVSARLIIFLFLALVLVLLVDAFRHGNFHAAMPRFDIATGSIGAFILFAASSALWAVEPDRTLARIGLAASIAFATFAVARIIQLQDSANVRSMAVGLWVGYLIGIVFFLIEFVTDQSVRIWLYNRLQVGAELLRPERYYLWEEGRLVNISSASLTRTIAPVTLLFWPVLMTVLGTVTKPRRRVVTLLLGALAIAVVMLSVHTTSKIAIVLGLLTYGFACKARQFTFYALATAWVLGFLVVVPAAHLMYRLDLHNASWLKASGQHRIILWKNTAEQIRKAPIAGVGADMNYVLGPAIDKTLPPDKFETSLSRHSHNTFLQTIFELGAVGALLLIMAGLGVLWQIRRLDAELQPFAYAMMAVGGVYFTASYGMWQTWYMSLFGIAAVLFALGRRSLEEAQTAPSVRVDAEVLRTGLKTKES